MKKLFLLLALVTLTLGMAGSVLAADEELSHTGRVLIATGGTIDVAADEQADAVVVVGGDVRIAGTVNTLLVVDGTATITGATLETIAIVNGVASLDGGTTVLGDVVQFGSTINRAQGVEIGGAVRDMAGDVAAFGIFMGAALIALWIGLGIATLLVGLLVAGLAARQVRVATSLISHEPGKTVLVGILSLIVPPILAFLAIITIVGIPTGIGLLVVVWPAVAFVGYVVAAIWLGEWILRQRESSTPADRPYGAAVVGLLVAFVIGFVPLVTAVLSIFGLGAVVLAAWRTLRGGGAPSQALQAQPAAAAA
jgi:hypothetical protein